MALLRCVGASTNQVRRQVLVEALVLGVIAGAYGAALPPAANNFLMALLENGRFSALTEIAKQFQALANAQSGSSDAVVYSAFPIDAAMRLLESLILFRAAAAVTRSPPAISDSLMASATVRASPNFSSGIWTLNSSSSDRSRSSAAVDFTPTSR